MKTTIDGSYFDVDDAIEKVNILRKKQFTSTIYFLVIINCYIIIEEIGHEFNWNDTGRDLIYKKLDEFEADLMTPRNIELNKIVACTSSKIRLYTNTLLPFLKDIPTILRFTKDETMLKVFINIVHTENFNL